MIKAIVAAIVLAASVSAMAQPASNIRVVPTCGSVTYPAGSPAPATQDVNGNACIGGTISATTAPAVLTSTPSGVTITTANTFQTGAASSAGRKGCTVQYTGAGGSTGYVFFGANGSATTSNSYQLAPGSTISCAIPGGVLTDNIALSSTVNSGTFVVSVQ